MAQLMLFSTHHPKPAAPDPGRTRAAAAESVASVAGTQRAAVLAFIRRCGARGATDAEICRALELSPDSGRARRCELRDAGLLRDSGDTRPSPSGRAMIVWIIAAAGDVGGGPDAWERGIPWEKLVLPAGPRASENAAKKTADGG